MKKSSQSTMNKGIRLFNLLTQWVRHFANGDKEYSTGFHEELALVIPCDKNQNKISSLKEMKNNH